MRLFSENTRQLAKNFGIAYDDDGSSIRKFGAYVCMAGVSMLFVGQKLNRWGK